MWQLHRPLQIVMKNAEWCMNVSWRVFQSTTADHPSSYAEIFNGIAFVPTTKNTSEKP
jgi:hypothetical protein